LTHPSSLPNQQGVAGEGKETVKAPENFGKVVYESGQERGSKGAVRELLIAHDDEKKQRR
jgi:hypothetical protein